MKLRIFLTIICFAVFVNIQAQTHTSPIIGFGTVEATTSLNPLMTTNTFYGSFPFERYYATQGISISQQFSKYFLLECSGVYAKPILLVSDRGFAAFTDMQYNVFRFSANGALRVLKTVEFGIGFSHQIQTNHVYGHTNGKYGRFPFLNKDNRFLSESYHNNIRMNGYNLSVSYCFDKLVLRLKYINPSAHQPIEELELNTYSHLELLLLYRFQISKRKS